MTKFLKFPSVWLILLIILVVNPCSGQQKKITIKSSDISLQKALDTVVVLAGYELFYNPNLDLSVKKKVNLNGVELPYALNALVESTDYNFYIKNDEKRVFILKNAIIYEDLPSSFFKDKAVQKLNDAYQAKTVSPIFLQSFEPSKENNATPIYIGKSSLDNTRETYTIKGKVLLENSNEPIANLVVINKSTGVTAVTNNLGEFTMNMPYSLNKLSFKAMGIKNKTQDIFVYNNGDFKIYLSESLEQLKEVVVEADLMNNVTEANTGKEKFNNEQTKEIPLVLGERNVLQIAKALPGISSAGEGAGGINVRGGKSDQNLILFDQTVIYNPTHFFGIFQALNPFVVDEIEIYKADAPLKYGGRLSSVIDIKSEKQYFNKVQVEGSVGPVTGNISIDLPLKKDTTSLVIGARGAYADYILKMLEDENLKNSRASFYDGVVKLNHKISENESINATGYHSGDTFSVTRDSLFNYTNTAGSFIWNHPINLKTNGQLNINHSRYNFNIDYDEEGNRDFTLGYGINETAINYDLSKRINPKIKLNYGLSSKFYGVDPGNIKPANDESDIEAKQIQKEKAIESAIYIGGNLQLGEKWQVNAGARLNLFTPLGERYQRTYTANNPKNEGTVQDTINYKNFESIKMYGGPEGRVSFRYLINPELSLKASFNNSFQFLHTLSSNTTVSPIDTWKLSDLNIKPQSSFQSSLGIYKNLNENTYEISIEGYYKRMNNVLDFKTGAELFLNENVETEILQGKGKAYGVEFMLKKNKGDLNGWLSYTYSRSLYSFSSQFEEETINNGDFFPSNFDKPHDVSLITNYRLTRRFSFSMNFVYQTGRPVTYPIGTYRFNNADFVVFSERNKFRIPDYYRLDLGFNMEGNHKKKKLAHSFITFQVYNVLGRNNPYSVFFVTEEGEVKALQSSVFGVPIPSITYNFKF